MDIYLVFNHTKESVKIILVSTTSIFLFLASIFFCMRFKMYEKSGVENNYAINYLYYQAKCWLCSLGFIVSLVVVSMLIFGAPILSDDPNSSRLDLISNHSFLARSINHIIPFFYFTYLYFYASLKREVNLNGLMYKYLPLFLYMIPSILLANKSSVLTSLLLVIIYSRSVIRIKIFNESIMIFSGIFMLVVMFVIHLKSSDLAFIFSSISERGSDFSGIDIVFNDYVPVEGYAKGITIIDELGSLLNLFGIDVISQTTGNYISRWYYGFDSDYLFELVFPVYVVGYLNGGILLAWLLSIICGFLFVSFYMKSLNFSGSKNVLYFLLSQTMLAIFMSGKPGSYFVSNILTYTVLYFMIHISNSFFLARFSRDI